MIKCYLASKLAGNILGVDIIASIVKPTSSHTIFACFNSHHTNPWLRTYSCCCVKWHPLGWGPLRACRITHLSNYMMSMRTMMAMMIWMMSRMAMMMMRMMIRIRMIRKMMARIVIRMRMRMGSRMKLSMMTMMMMMRMLM